MFIPAPFGRVGSGIFIHIASSMKRTISSARSVGAVSEFHGYVGSFFASSAAGISLVEKVATLPLPTLIFVIPDVFFVPFVSPFVVVAVLVAAAAVVLFFLIYPCPVSFLPESLTLMLLPIIVLRSIAIPFSSISFNRRSIIPKPTRVAINELNGGCNFARRGTAGTRRFNTLQKCVHPR